MKLAPEEAWPDERGLESDFAGCLPALWDGQERRRIVRAGDEMAKHRQELASALRAAAQRAREATEDYWQGVEDDSMADYHNSERTRKGEL